MQPRSLGPAALFAFSLALTGAADAAPAQQFPRVVSTTTVRIGDFERTDTIVQVAANPIERFTYHRLVERGHGHRDARHGSDDEPRGILLLLPPLSNPFGFYEVDERGDYRRSFAAYFADRGYEVWGYSPRGTGLAAGSCESGAVDCSVMAHWGIQSVVDDAAYIRARIRSRHPHRKPVVGGYSLGGMTTIATINAHPHDYAGAMILEGALYAEEPIVLAMNQGFCADLEGALAAGVIFDGTTLPGVRTIALLARDDPHSPTPLPGFPPGTTNHQVLVAILSLNQPGPLWPTPDFIRCAGSVPEDRFFFSDDARVIAHSLLFNNYTDTLTVRDVSCSLGGEPTFTGNLGSFRAPVYLLGGGLAFSATRTRPSPTSSAPPRSPATTSPPSATPTTGSAPITGRCWSRTSCAGWSRCATTTTTDVITARTTRRYRHTGTPRFFRSSGQQSAG